MIRTIIRLGDRNTLKLARRERARFRRRMWYLRNAAKERARVRAYRIRNAERVRAKEAERYRRRLEARRAYHRRYYEMNPARQEYLRDKQREYRAARRASCQLSQR